MKVRIDAAIYDVQQTDDLIILAGQECRGDVDYNLCRIRLGSKAIGDGRKVITLMHEIVHAMLYERGLDKESDDEHLVNEMACGIVNMIRDNPELIDKIKNGERLF